MKELKTLKDIGVGRVIDDDGTESPVMVGFLDLKREAIKYIKEIIRIAQINNSNFSLKDLPKVKFTEKTIEFNNDKWNISSPEFSLFVFGGSSYIVMIGIIAHIFNISEEDLSNA